MRGNTMLHKKLVLLVLFILSLSLVNGAFLMDENLYISDVQDSLLAFGSSVTVMGDTSGSQFIVAGSINIDSTTNLKGGDVIFVGNSVRIDGDIEGSLIIISNNVIIGENSNLEGDVLITAADVAFEGDAKNALTVNSNKFLFNGRVEGDLLVNSDSVQVTSDSYVEGEFSLSTDYFHGVEGTYKNGIDGAKPEFNAQSESFRNILSLLIFGLIIIWFAHKTDRKLSLVYMYDVSRAFIYGLFTVIVFPLFILLLLVLGVSNIFAMLLTGVFLVLLLMGIFLGILRLGHYVLNSFKLVDNDVLSFLAGLFIVFFLRYVPYLGGLILVIVVVIGVGMSKKMLINRFHGTPIFQFKRMNFSSSSKKTSSKRKVTARKKPAKRVVKKKVVKRKIPAKKRTASARKRPSKKVVRKTNKNLRKKEGNFF